MNGRCSNDPLDMAEEICSICANEFCHKCMVQTRSKRTRLVCKQCAINHSGIRTDKKTPIATQRQIRNNQSKLVANTPADGVNNGFTYFDDPDSTFGYDAERAGEVGTVEAVSSEPLDSTSTESPKGSRGKLRSFLRRSDKRSAEVMRDSNNSEAELEQANAGPSSAVSAPVAIQPDTTFERPEPVSTTRPSPLPEDAGHEYASDAGQGMTRPTATELLSRLQQDSAIERPLEVDSPNDIHPVAATTVPPVKAELPDPNEVAPPTNPRSSLAPPIPAEQSSFGSMDTAPSMADDPFATKPDLTTSPFSNSQPEPPNLPRSSGQSGNLSGQARRSTDPQVTPDPIPPAPTPPAIPGRPLVPSAASSGQAQTDHDPFQTSTLPSQPSQSLGVSETKSDDLESDGADTDASGNWIPPSLRGMAPVAEREKVVLPRRKSDQ